MRLKRFWRGLEAALDAIILGWDMLMMYVAALFLIPLSLAASLKLLGIEAPLLALQPIRPESGWVRVLLLGAPLWLGITVYASLSSAPWAVRFSAFVARLKWAVVWATCAALGVFAVLALVIGK